MHDLEPVFSPAAHEFVGVHLGSAGVGVVEIAPSEHMHPADPALAQVGEVPREIAVVLLGVRGRVRAPRIAFSPNAMIGSPTHDRRGYAVRGAL